VVAVLCEACNGGSFDRVEHNFPVTKFNNCLCRLEANVVLGRVTEHVDTVDWVSHGLSPDPVTLDVFQGSTDGCPSKDLRDLLVDWCLGNPVIDKRQNTEKVSECHA
jgi:hypothetical protein